MQWLLTYTILHLCHHIYDNKNPERTPILHLYNHIYNTMSLNINDSPFVVSHL